MIAPPLIGFPRPEERDQILADSFARHRESPDPAYRLTRRLDLTREVMRRVVVYLDTRYWLLFRDAQLGRPQHPSHPPLLDLLRSAVTAGKAICPLAEAQFLELLKQTDPRTRQTTAELMDELSQGVALSSGEDRAVMEVLDLLRSLSAGSPQPPVWAPFTRTGYTIGDATPIPEGFPPSQHKLIQDAFDDRMWTISLVEMLDTLGESVAEMPTLDYGRMAREFNEGKFAHDTEIATFRQAYLSEVQGALDGYQDLIGEALDKLGLVDPTIHGTAKPELVAARAVIPVLYEGWAEGRFATRLPAFDVLATLHAAMRWNRTRKYKPNDWLDFRHALAAIPHSSLFLTERSLAALVQEKALGLTTKYRTIVHSDPSAAHEALAVLVA